MAVIPYINFTNKAKEAIDFYIAALDGEDLRIAYYSDLPESVEHPLSDKEKQLIANASFNIANGTIMVSDVPESMFTLRPGDHTSINLTYQDKDRLKKHFERLSAGGHINVPLGETPWSKLYGMLTDKFGIIWQLTYTPDDYI